MWWFDGTDWIYAQQRTQLNQGPLFDLFDSSGASYSDKRQYLTDFVGNKVFGYSINNDSSVVDEVLNLKLDYLNNNVNSSILFENYFSKTIINILKFPNDTYRINNSQTYLKVDNQLVNVWQPPKSPEITIDTNTGYYNIPLSLTNNPLNDNLDKMVAGDLRDQKTKSGTRLIANADPIIFSMIFVATQEHNIIEAIDRQSAAYDYFKLSLINKLSLANTPNNPAVALDQILEKINAGRTLQSPYYLSDMLGYGNSKITVEYSVSNLRTLSFPIPEEFYLKSPSNNSTLDYLNNIQLTRNIDYVFDENDPYVKILKTLKLGDKLKIDFYNDTKKNYIPQTPTKLGLYPSFVPKIYLDDTYATPVNVIQGHDGSVMIAFNDYRDAIILEYELRVYNNLKVSYRNDLVDPHSVYPGIWRNRLGLNNYTYSEVSTILEKDLVP
jgi:hypothetical protein